MEMSYFQQWRSSTSVFLQADKELPHDSLAWSSGYKKLREMWVMSGFAIGYSLVLNTDSYVKLGEQEPADAQLKINETIEDYQITECLDPERRRHDEYKEMEKNDGIRLLNCPITSKEDFISVIVSGALKKDKQYNLNLLIYINLMHEKIGLDKIHEAIVKLNLKYLKKIWLLAPVSGKNPSFVIGKVFPETEGFYPFDPFEKRTLTQQEYTQPFPGWYLI